MHGHSCGVVSEGLGVLGAPLGHPLPRPPGTQRGKFELVPLTRWGFCTLKCKPAFQCKCCERLGPIKARGQGGAWPQDRLPKAPRCVSGVEGGAAASCRTQRPQPRLGSAA